MNSQATPSTDELTEEEKKQRELQEDVSSQTQELSALSQIIVGFGLYRVSEQAKVTVAVDHLTQKRFAGKLLSLNRPEDFYTLKEALFAAKHEMEKRQKRDPKKTEFSAGWGKWKRTITAETIHKQEQAIHIAEAVHVKVNADELQIKFAAASTYHGCNQQELVRDYITWRKNDPTGNPNDYLVEKIIQQHEKTNGKLSVFQRWRKTGKIERQFSEQTASARKIAIKQNIPVVLRARDTMKQSLDGTLVLPTDTAERTAAINKTLFVSPPPTAPGNPALSVSQIRTKESEQLLQALSASPAPHKEMDDLYDDIMMSPTSTTPKSTPIVPRSPSLFPPSLFPSSVGSSRLAPWLNKLQSLKNFLSGGIGSGLNVLGSSGIGASIRSGLSVLGGGLGSVASLAPPLRAAMVADRLLNILSGGTINLSQWAKYGAIAVVVLIIMFVMSSSGSGSDLFPAGDTYNVRAYTPEKNPIGWNMFEEDFLLADSPSNRNQAPLSQWKQFEEHHLASQ